MEDRVYILQRYSPFLIYQENHVILQENLLQIDKVLMGSRPQRLNLSLAALNFDLLDNPYL